MSTETQSAQTQAQTDAGQQKIADGQDWDGPFDPERAKQTLAHLREVEKNLEKSLREKDHVIAQLKPLAEQFQQKQEENKTEQEKVSEALTQLQQQLDQERLARWQAEAMAKYGLGDAQRHFLSGSTAEEVEVSAQRFMEAAKTFTKATLQPDRSQNATAADSGKPSPTTQAGKDLYAQRKNKT